MNFDPAQFSQGFLEGLKLSTTLALGLLVAWIAFQQWLTARNKLALDLFDRRFAAYKEVLAAMQARSDEIRSRGSHDSALGGHFETAALSEFWRVSNDARFLFGPDVHEALDRMDTNLREQAKTHLEFVTVGPTKHEVYMLTVSDMWTISGQFRAAVERYLMMGHIAVARPSKDRKKRPSLRR